MNKSTNKQKRGINMKLNFDYKGTKVTYYLTYKKTKAISINIEKNGQVNVTAPIGTSVYAVMDKVKGNAPWIIAQISKNTGASLKHETHTVSEVNLLEQYTYLGKNYKLEINRNSEADSIKVKMVRGKFVVETAVEDKYAIREAIVEWYRDKVTTKLKERLKVYKDEFKEVPTKFIVEDRGNILFRISGDTIETNVRLGILSADVIDFMLVKSLAHRNFPGKEEEVLERLLPNYKKSEEMLNDNKTKLSL